MLKVKPLYLKILLFISVSFTQLQAQEKSLYDSAKQLLPNRVKEAEKVALQFHRQSVEKGADSSIARANYLLGIVNYYLAKYYVAADYFEKALASDFVKNDIILAESCWNNIGVAYDKLNIIPESLKAYQESLKIAEKRKDSVGIGQTLINIGLLAGKVKNYKDAAATTRKALSFFEKIQDTLNMGLCYQNLSVFFSDQFMYDSSEVLIKKSLILFKAIGYQYGVVELTNNLAVIYSARKQFDAARQLQNEGLAIAKEIGMIDFEGVIYMTLGENALAERKPAEAEKYFTDAMRMLDSSGNYENHENIYWQLADVYAMQGNYAKYSATIGKFRDFLNTQNKESAMARYDELKNLYEHEKNEARIREQAQQLKQRRNQLIIMGIAILLICSALVVITRQYIRTRKLIRSLYLSNVAQTKSRQALVPENETLSEDKKLPHHDLYQRIVQLMETQQLFVRSNLSLADISNELGSNEKYISQAINTYSGNNFNVFLNQYRVNEAKRLMLEGEDLTLKQIAANCGFSNTSTFYRQFKELTGLTPSTFYAMRKQELQEKGD